MSDGIGWREPGTSEHRSRSHMVVVTPTYAPDLPMFADLHRSFLHCFPEEVKHLVVTPRADQDLFRQFEGTRCTVYSLAEVLPQRMVSVPFANMWLNWRRPVPPVRGWIMQQLVKLAVADQVDERIVILADSDLSFIRRVTDETFAPGGHVRLYREEGGVTESLPRHRRWHEVARQLLRLPAPPDGPLPDYILPLNSWDREVVHGMLERVSSTRRGSWTDLIGSRLHFSEFTLYGVHCESLLDGPAGEVTDDGLCACYWETHPLDGSAIESFSSSVRSSDVAIMISAKSGTPLTVRRGIIDDLRVP